MGCWNDTCALTNLPVMYGDEVAVLFLYENITKDNSCYATRYYHPAPQLIYGKYDDYGGVEKFSGEQQGFLLQCFTECLNNQPKTLDFDSVFELRKENREFGWSLKSVGIFRDYLKDPRKPHPMLHHTVILKSVLDRFLDTYSWDAYNGETKDYDKITYQSYLNSIDEFYEICGGYFTQGFTLNRIPGHRELKDNLIGHAARTYIENDGGLFFRLELADTLKEYVLKKDKAGFTQFLTDFAKFHMIRDFMQRSRRPFIVPQSGSQDNSTDAQRMMASITLDVGRMIDRRWEE